MKRIIKTSLGVTSLAIVVLSMALEANALSAGGMSIAPAVNPTFPNRNKGWFVYEQIEPGAVIEDVARVINLDSKPITLTIEAVDATMNDDGGFGLVGDPSENQDIGTWIELSKTEVTLEGGKEEIVPFKITIPNDAEVGDHIGGLAVYQTVPKNANGTLGGSQVSVSTRVGARVYLTIKGDIVRSTKLLKKHLYGRGQNLVFGFSIKNNGNVRADLSLSAKIYGIWGLFDKKENISIGQAFAGKTINLQATWPGKNRPMFGPYLAKVTIDDIYKGLNPASTNPLPATTPINTWVFAFFIPYTQTAVILGLLFLIWFGIQTNRWYGLKRLANTRVVTYKVKLGDGLVDVATKYGIGWKLLARLNDIQPPYSLHGVTNLYIPDASGSRGHKTVPNFLVYITNPIQQLVKLLGGRFARQKHQDEVIVVDVGDTKKDIETFTGITWAKIAKYNQLKPDARLKPGQELRLPKRRG